MEAADQVITIVKLLLHVGPVAIYFVVLGLVNSQATPRLVNARSDFLALTFVFSPLLFWPIPALVRSGLTWLVAVALVALAVGCACAFRRIDGGWVIYNVTTPRARRLLERAVRELGWGGTWSGDSLHIQGADLVLTLSSLPVLRNVTISFRADTDARRRAGRALEERFSALLATQQLLPSLSGSCLLLLGVGLLMLPLWMMARHSDAIADLVSRWLVS